MTTIKLTLSGSGISAAIQELEAYKNRVKALEDELPKSLGESARASASAASGSTVTVSLEHQNGMVAVVAEGEWLASKGLYSDPYVVNTAALEEFGFGIVGKGSYDRAVPLKWQYDQNNHGEAGWYYKENGQLKWSAGEVAKRYMFNAAEQIRSDVFSKAKELISR